MTDKYMASTRNWNNNNNDTNYRQGQEDGSSAGVGMEEGIIGSHGTQHWRKDNNNEGCQSGRRKSWNRYFEEEERNTQQGRSSQNNNERRVLQNASLRPSFVWNPFFKANASVSERETDSNNGRKSDSVHGQGIAREDPLSRSTNANESGPRQSPQQPHAVPPVFQEFELFEYHSLPERMLEIGMISILHDPTVYPIGSYAETEDFYPLFAHIMKQENVNKACLLKEKFLKLTPFEQVVAFEKATELPSEDKMKRKQVANELQELLEKEFPDGQLIPLGSSVTGLSGVESDLDFFMATDKRDIARPLNKHRIMKILRKVGGVLRKAQTGGFCEQLETIASAKVPIAKFYHSTSKVACDISFGNVIALRNAELIVLYMKLHPLVRTLMKFVRFWGKTHELIGKFKLKNYALAMLVIVYCGRRGLIPSVHIMRQTLNWLYQDREHIDGYDASFPHDEDLIRRSSIPSMRMDHSFNQVSALVKDLFKGFLDFYSKLAFGSVIICVNTFEIVERGSWFIPEDASKPVANAVKIYYEWVDRCNPKELLKLNTSDRPFCIQDPLALNRNVASITGYDIMDRFQKTCLTTLTILNRSPDASLIEWFLPPFVDLGPPKPKVFI